MKKGVIKKCIVLGIIILFVETTVVSAFYENQQDLNKPTNLGILWHVGGSGLGNLSTISEAVDMASDGDAIKVWNYSAPYDESFDINKSLEIFGEVDTYPIIKGDIDIRDYHQVIIKGFTFYYQSSFYSLLISHSSDIVIENNFFINDYNNSCACVDIILSSECIIRNNTFSGGGIYIIGSELGHYNSHTIENNNIGGRLIRYYKNLNGFIVPADTSQVFLANCYDVAIQNLNIYNVYDGISIDYSDNIIIKNNNIFNCSEYGIRIFSSNNVMLTHNDINNNLCAIDATSNTYLTISNNNISFNELYGIYIGDGTYNTIENNRIFNNLGNSILTCIAIGIYNDVEGYFGRSLINNNQIYNNDYGIGVGSCQYIEVTNNVIHDTRNIALGVGGNTLGACANNQINNNDISNNKDGILLFNSYLNSFSNNLIKDNTNRSILIVNSRWDKFKHNCIYGYPPLVDSVGSWTIAPLNFWGRPMILPWLYMRRVLSWTQCFPPLLQPPDNVGPQS